jgi:hypothetical protein
LFADALKAVNMQIIQCTCRKTYKNTNNKPNDTPMRLTNTCNNSKKKGEKLLNE